MYLKNQDIILQDKPLVTVIICGKNEASNIFKNLKSILTQDYPAFNVLYVDDGSTDKTRKIIEGFQKEFVNLKYLFIPTEEKVGVGKKYALSKGIETCNSEWVVLTDADCYPNNNKWISTLMNSRNIDTEIILGVSPLVHQKQSLLSKLIDFETFNTATQYIAWANAKQPYMAVGRNLAYKKELFYKNNGFEHHKHIASGDDDLFVMQNASSKNTATCLSFNGYTFSEAPTSWRNWTLQKSRHYSAGYLYPFSTKLVLALVLVSKLFVHIMGIYFSINKSAIAILYPIYLLFIVVFYLLSRKKIKMKLAIIYLPFLDIFGLIIMLLQGIFSKLKTQNLWK